MGLQLEKTGHRENQTKIVQKIHDFSDDSQRIWFDFLSNQILLDIFFHRFGNIVIIQKNKIIVQDIFVRIDLSNHIKNVVAFNNNENTIIEKESAKIIIYGLDLSSCNEEPSIIGKSGKTHGASTVNIPAKNEIIKIGIYKLFNFTNYII